MSLMLLSCSPQTNKHTNEINTFQFFEKNFIDFMNIFSSKFRIMNAVILANTDIKTTYSTNNAVALSSCYNVKRILHFLNV